jgi:uncharacterized C2H2 Zn-finger protein
MERPKLVTVYIRCERCQAKFGDAAPVMGHVVESPDLGHRWMVDRWKRRPSRLGRPRHSDADTDEVYVPGRGARGLQLRCRRCGHAPRVAIRRLHALADTATIRAGRGDIYV